MFAAQFEYHRANSVDEAVGLLERYGDDARLLAGGHSLLPLMKLRLAQPAHLIDIRRIAGLSGIKEEGGHIVIGAASTHTSIQYSESVKLRLPMLAEAAARIGDPLVRNMGTIGGSLAHGDPAADFPAVVLAYDAQLVVVGPSGSRTIAAPDFFTGLFQTALEPGEVLTEIRIPVPPAGTGAAYEKHAHPASGYAVVGVAAVLTAGSGNAITQVRVGVTGLGASAARARATEQMLSGQNITADLLQLAAAKAADGIDVRSDLYAPREYRSQLARVCAERALVKAAEGSAQTKRVWSRSSMVTIKVTANGPYLVEGDDIKLIDWRGQEFPVPNRRSFALCRCGGSMNKPLCDGTHSRCGFKAAQLAPGSIDPSGL